MGKTVKQRWLEALRSGKYKQGTSCLRQNEDDEEDYFCCLGVLCDIIDHDAWLDSATDGNHKFFAWRHENITAYVFSHAKYPDGEPNLTNSDGIRLSREFAKGLALRNDGHGWSFERIADFIEANLPE